MKKNILTKHIAVYCSASDRLPDEWIATARLIGRVIGENNATLVYGGVDAGLMRAVAVGVKTVGSGHIIGVVPAKRAEIASPLNDEVIPCAGLDDRKAEMQRLADLYIVLPGGYGTLDELTGAIAYLRFNSIADKKILLFNPDGLLDNLLDQFNTLIERGLMLRDSISALEVFDNAEALVDRLKLFLTSHQL